VKIESGLIETGSKKFSEIEDFRQLNGYGHLACNPRWPVFIESIYGHKAYYIEVKSGNKILAYAIGNLCRISTSGTNKLVLGAFLDFGTKMYSSVTETKEIDLIDMGMLSGMKTRGIIAKEIKPLTELANQSQAVIQLLDHSLESIQKHITSRARNDLRQFEVHGNSLLVGDRYLPEFYEMYVKRMKEFGTPAHSLKYFKELQKHFNSQIVVSFDQSGFPAAASLSVCEDGAWLHMYAVGDRSRRKGNPGDRVLWEEIEMSIRMQSQSFWLGRSIRNSEVEKYKGKWNPQFYSTGDTLGSRYHPELGFQEINKFGVKNSFADVWSKIPVSLTSMTNSLVRKYIP